MGAVKILSSDIVDLIAAGEVIERPASVVKELVENSIDAGATRIETEIRNGGRSLIRVTDNGCGMDRDDLILAVESHATSKIKEPTDLASLSTLGFRGEALSSIAAVANLTVQSRMSGHESGYRLTAGYGQEKKLKQCGLPEGTTVLVEDLFAKLPARLKYLKSIPTEAGYIADILGKLAVAHPGISFRLIHHEYEILFTPGSGDRLEAVTAVFGRDVAREMLPASDSRGSAEIACLLGKPSIARTNRHYELFFLNGRYIRSRLVGSALEKAYRSLLPIARYPFGLIFLRLEPDEVDVNVHPSKLEVRFSDESHIYRSVYDCVHKALSSSSLFYSWDNGGGMGTRSREGSPAKDEAAVAAEACRRAVSSEAGEEESSRAGTAGMPEDRLLLLNENRFHSLGISLKSTYILAWDDEGFLLVDQHAAHERILFERYRAAQGRVLAAQKLLLPVTVKLTPAQAGVMHEQGSILADLGFDLEPFGGNTYLLRAMPAALSRLDGARLIVDLLDDLLHQQAGEEKAARHRICLESMACHAAVRAGEAMSPPEMQGLLDALAATETPFTCPHGRPTVIRLGWEEIERRFKRR